MKLRESARGQKRSRAVTLRATLAGMMLLIQLAGAAHSAAAAEVIATANQTELVQPQDERSNIIVKVDRPRRAAAGFHEDFRLINRHILRDDHYLIRLRLIAQTRPALQKLFNVFPESNDSKRRTPHSFRAVTPDGVYYWNPFDENGVWAGSYPRFGHLADDLELADLRNDEDAQTILGEKPVAFWRETLKYFADEFSGDEHIVRLDDYQTRPKLGATIGIELGIYVQEEYDEARAQQIARGMLKIIERGVRQPLLHQIAEREAEVQQALTEQEAKYKDLVEQLDASTKAAGDTVNLSPESVSDIRTNARLLSVEYVGLKAKVAKCEDILTARKQELAKVLDEGEKAITRQVEGMKLEAEVQLASLAARKEVYDSLLAQISEADQLEGLRKSVSSASSTVRKFRSVLGDAQELQKTLSSLQLYQQTIEVIQLKSGDTN